MESTNVSDRILRETREAIQNELGSLDDISYELANTVANIYYRFYCWVDSGPPHIPNSELFDSISKFAREMTEHQEIWKIISQIRAVRKEGVHAEWVQILEEFALSVLKYKIDNAVNKSPVRLKFERFLNRSKVDEIPNLVDLLDLRREVSKRPELA